MLTAPRWPCLGHICVVTPTRGIGERGVYNAPEKTLVCRKDNRQSAIGFKQLVVLQAGGCWLGNGCCDCYGNMFKRLMLSTRNPGDCDKDLVVPQTGVFGSTDRTLLFFRQELVVLQT